MATLPHVSNRPGQRPYRAAGTAPITAPSRRAVQGPPLQAPEAAIEDYDPFALLDAHEAQAREAQRHTGSGQTAATATPAAPTAINAHPVDTDANGGLHTGGLSSGGVTTSGLHTGHLSSGNLRGGPTPVGQQPQVNVVNDGGATTGNARSRQAATYPASPGTGGGGTLDASPDARSDGSQFVAVPTRGTNGQQTGWQYVTPAAAEWSEKFGHLPGTASHPTTYAENNGGNQFPQVPRGAGGPVGKLSQSAPVPVHTVNAGESAFVNGQPVPAGHTVIMGPTGPMILPPSPAQASNPTAAVPAAARPVPTIPTSPLLNAPGTLTQLPATNFPQVPKSPATPAAFDPGQVAAAPKLALSTGSTPAAAAPAPLGLQASTSLPAAPVAYQPAAPAAPATRAQDPDAALASAITTSMANNPIAAARMNPSFAPSTVPTARQVTGNAPVQDSVSTPASAPAAAPVKVVNAPVDRNNLIGTPDFRTERVAPAALATNNTSANTSAATPTSLLLSNFPAPPTNSTSLATPKPLTLASTAPSTPPSIPTNLGANPESDDELRKKLAGANSAAAGGSGN